jgi:hypothetical protein
MFFITYLFSLIRSLDRSRERVTCNKIQTLLVYFTLDLLYTPIT